MTEQQIIDRYLQVPYKHMGRDTTGLDCWGLALNIYKDNGIHLEDFTYSEQVIPKERTDIFVNYHKQWEEVNKPDFFDLVLLEHENSPHHVGVVMKYGKFIHMSRLGVLFDTLERYNRYIKGFYRLK